MTDKIFNLYNSRDCRVYLFYDIISAKKFAKMFKGTVERSEKTQNLLVYIR